MADKTRRKHISWRTKCASALLAYAMERYKGPLWYTDAKKMTEHQFLSLFHFDHNRLHTFKGEDVYWNLTPMLRKAHKEKTREDAKIIAKSRRIRTKADARRSQKALLDWSNALHGPHGNIVVAMGEAVRAGFEAGAKNAYERMNEPRDLYAENYSAIDWNKKPKRKIRSRGFDKKLTRGFDGKTKPRRTSHAKARQSRDPPP